MPTTHLDQRALIDISGADAEHFLQNLITTDLTQLTPGTLRPGALLTPQGKILFDFLIARTGAEAFALECRSDVADDLVKRLTLYRLRAKVEITKRDQSLVGVSWSDESRGSQIDSGLIDTRFDETSRVRRHWDDLPDTTATPQDWNAMRAAHGVAESGSDFELSDVFPHDVLYDFNGGLGLKKGCYVGQEVVSRMQHRGTARRRIMLVSGDGGLPASGSAVTAGGRPVGMLGSSVQGKGMAILRIDKVAATLAAGGTIEAGGVALDVAVPDWAGYRLPQDAPGGED